MTASEVIKLGQDIEKIDLGMFSQLSLNIVLIILGFLVAGIALGYWAHVDPFSEFFRAFGSLSLIGIGVALILCWCFLFPNQKAEELYQEEIEQWRVNYVIPYIESLPLDQREIVYIKIDTEIHSDVKGQSSWFYGYTRTSEVHRTPLTISYKSNGIVTETNWYETYMELTDQEKPYIEFNYLDQSLGHGVTAGKYNSKIYLPESYEFTDIK
ncbi:hypothetical protein PQ478_08945 [Alkalihalophilus pseudofirmus]|uniref:hypothetical protein n=1 Tax=Alkalihalophilus pseudofirmus TaxID=79885 RepID=UPI00259BE5E6|nr:hypothetical protein [Alkalihalophilus pseudofirmus]WEG18597.1 hypothetical protein PQ478_08945 [Alkalihalophilus pseudofirmus]